MYLDVYRDGQLLYPNRVAAVRASGDIIVTERSPTHQVQIYNQYGQFVRKFGANILQVIGVHILMKIVVTLRHVYQENIISSNITQLYNLASSRRVCG